MLFQSTVPQVFTNMGLKLYSSANNERKTLAAKKLNFYHNSQMPYIDELLAKFFAEPDSKLKIELNIFRKIINNLAQIYCQPPVRTLTGSEKEKALFSQIVEDAKLNLKLKQAGRYVKFLGTILLRVVWRNNKIDLDILTPNLLDCEWGDTPEDLRLVMTTDYGQSEKPEDVEYSLWSPTTFKRLNYKGDVLYSEPNPYQILPFIPIFDSLPTSNNFWLSSIGESLISQQEAISLKMIDLLHLLFHQSFGVGWIKGQRTEDEGMPLGVGPGVLVELPPEGEIGYTSQKAAISDVVEACDRLLKWCCVSNGLSAAAMTTDPTVASGISKFYDSVELSEMRTEDKILWQHYEKQLFQIIRIVQNAHGKDRFQEKASLAINFADPVSTTESLQSEAQAYAEYYKMGVMSPVDILMQRDRDLRTREEALEKLKLIKQENEALNLAPQGVKLEKI